MTYNSRELLESALKRVNALAGTKCKLYKDATGWFIIRNGASHFDESSLPAGELLAYLHGVEDAIKFINEHKEG